MDRSVFIDYRPRCDAAWRGCDAVVVIDVIRAMTTAVTAAALGRRCLPVATVEEAFAATGVLERPLLVGEIGGRRPLGFHLNNSPAAMASRQDVERPMVLMSSSGTPLISEVSSCPAVYLGCFRNHRAVARRIATALHQRVAVLGAGTRGEFREEDQMCCAWIAEQLVHAGFAAEGEETALLIERWSGAPDNAFLDSRSVDYLRASGQHEDLDFILDHFGDVDEAYVMQGGEVIAAPELWTPSPALDEVRAPGCDHAAR